jgi:hypothetical protein
MGQPTLNQELRFSTQKNYRKTDSHLEGSTTMTFPFAFWLPKTHDDLLPPKAPPRPKARKTSEHHLNWGLQNPKELLELGLQNPKNFPWNSR